MSCVSALQCGAPHARVDFLATFRKLGCKLSAWTFSGAVTPSASLGSRSHPTPVVAVALRGERCAEAHRLSGCKCLAAWATGKCLYQLRQGQPRMIYTVAGCPSRLRRHRDLRHAAAVSVLVH